MELIGVKKMIDEKKLIEEISKRGVAFTEEQIDLLEYLIEKQPKVIYPLSDCVGDCKNCWKTKLVNGTNGSKWIPCEIDMPPQPKENPLFENKPLELYLVSVEFADYPLRVFWNGRFFTDGWSKVEVIAWQPLPQAYKGE